MKLNTALTIGEIASYINGIIIGDTNAFVLGFNEIHKVTEGDLTYVDHPKYYNKALQSKATVIIIDKEVSCPFGKALIIVNQPFNAYVALTKKYRPFQPITHTIGSNTVIHPSTIILPNVVIGNNVSIGANTILHPNVTIYDHTTIGDNVIIHAGSVIGSDAFYYKKWNDSEIVYDKMHSCGTTIIHNDVEIGSCCTIDRGVSGDTIIGQGTKLDNQVHIGHGVVIGRNCLIAAQVGISGKSTLEDNVTLWGQVGINKDLTIGAGAVVYAQSGVPSSLAGGKTYFGSPAGEAKYKMKEIAWIKRLPEIWKKLS